MRYTEYHAGKAVIKDKSLLPEAIEKLAEFEEKEKCGEWLDAIELAKIAIALQSQKWIPCSERLPEKPEVYSFDGYIVQSRHVIQPFSAYWDGREWTDDDEMVSLADIAVSMLMEIEEQPTAFDVKNVIEQLEEESEQSFVNFKSYAEEHGIDNDYEDWFYRGLIRAIEIVKRGGRDER